MAYIPETSSVVAFQSDPTKLVATVSVVGQIGSSIIGTVPVVQSGTVITSVSGAVSVAGRVLITDPTGAEMDLFKQGDNFAVGSDHGLGILGLSDGTPQKYAFIRVEGVDDDNETPITAGALSAEAYLIALNQQGTFDRIRTGSTLGALLVSQADKSITSISGTVALSPSIFGASIIGTVPITGDLAVSSASVVQQGTWIVSVAGTVALSPSIFGSSVIGTVPVVQSGTVISSVSGTIALSPSIFGASIMGTVPVVQSGTNITSISGIPQASVHGAVSVAGGNINTLQAGTWRVSVLGIASVSGTVGASIVGLPTVVINDTVTPSSIIEGYNSVVSGSVTTLVAAQGAGVKNYITDIWLANTGSVATLVTFRAQGGASVLGYTIAPAKSGSNIIGLRTPIQTGANQTFDIQATTQVSVLYATVKGYKAA